MPRQIILKPDFEQTGEIIVWSTIVDRIVFDGLAVDYIHSHCQHIANEESHRLVNKILGLSDGTVLPWKWEMTYERAMDEEKLHSGLIQCKFCDETATTRCCNSGCPICENHSDEDSGCCPEHTEEVTCQP